MVWTREVSERGKLSLSASRMATRVTSGRSRPSRSRLIPTRVSNSPRRRSREDLDPLHGVDLRVQVADPQAHLEQVVGQVLGHLLGQGGDQRPAGRASTRPRTSWIRSSIWPLVERTTTSGSTRPVGADDLLDHRAPTRAARTGRGWPRRTPRWPTRSRTRRSAAAGWSIADGSRKPCSTRVALRLWSPSYWPWSWGTVTWRLVQEQHEVVGEVVEQGERRLAGARPSIGRE